MQSRFIKDKEVETEKITEDLAGLPVGFSFMQELLFFCWPLL